MAAETPAVVALALFGAGAAVGLGVLAIDPAARDALRRVLLDPHTRKAIDAMFLLLEPLE